MTLSDAAIYRSNPTHGQREERAAVLLHEMAHMWFGDIVTMRWWDDLWLNEAFAEWAANWATAAATEFTDKWAGFLTGAKLAGYRADRAPTTHPIRQEVRDVAQAAAGFDDITYWKGASVLKQLVAYVGEDTFVAGLRTYFAKHAWGNASLDDLVAELARRERPRPVPLGDGLAGDRRHRRGCPWSARRPLRAARRRAVRWRAAAAPPRRRRVRPRC